MYIYLFVCLPVCLFVCLHYYVVSTCLCIQHLFIYKLFICLATPRDAEHGVDSTDGAASTPIIKKLFYEELVFSWITAHPATRAVVYSNAWFFFEVLVSY